MHTYNLAVTWDRSSTMIGVDPATGRKTFHLEGTDRGEKVTIEPKHHGSKLYQSLCFGPDSIEDDNEVSVNGQSVGKARFSNVPLDEWPNAVHDPELGPGYGVIAHVDLEEDDPFIQSLWTEVRGWVKTADKKEEEEVDAQIQRDRDMTARTPLVDQVNIDVTIQRARDTPDTGTWKDFPFLRSLAFGKADELGITIYTQRWEGREQGYDYTLLKDTDTLYGALVDYMRENKSS